MILENAKGMRDFLPEQEIAQQKIIDKLKEIFELYGYSPMDTPAVEKFDVLSSKYAGGDEILKETFKLTDQGKRRLGLRYDLTVPFARVVGMNPKMKMPFKRYQIGKVWRDGPVGMARYREFLQSDVDVVASSLKYDAELIMLAQRFFREFGIETVIKINNRKILNDIMKSLGIKDADSVILTIDKLEKFGKEEVVKELKSKGVKKIDELMKIIAIKGSNKEKIKKLEKILPKSQGLKELKEVLSMCKAEFEVSLARGLSYYTGTIIEVYIKNSKVKSSVCAGGRYDNLIGSIGKGNFPAVGISFGMSRIFEALELESKKTVTQLYLIPIGTMDESIKIAEKLRDKGMKVEVDLAGRGPSKNMKYANSLGIPFVGFIGSDELKDMKIKIKDMSSGKETLVRVEKVKEFLS